MRPRTPARPSPFLCLVLSVVACAPSIALGQTTERVNLDSSGMQANNDANAISISADGRFVVFSSIATNLVSGDTNGVEDAFLRDRLTGVTERVSVDSAGNQADQQSWPTWVSSDGRFVTMGSPATNLVAGDTNGTYDVFIRDRGLGMTERVSVSTAGVEGNGGSSTASGTPDGRFIVYTSNATNLVGGDTNGVSDIFLRDRLLGTTEMVSINTAGVQGNYGSFLPTISDDGRFVAFTSWATNLVAGTNPSYRNSYVRDRLLSTTIRVNVSTSGAAANGDTIECMISGNGQFVAFSSGATNLVAGDTNGYFDIFVRDLLNSTTERIDLATGGAQLSHGGAISDNGMWPFISGDGRYVLFQSGSMDAVPGKSNSQLDLFIRDRLTATTERISVSASGAEANAGSLDPVLSADGRYVAFLSGASNLVAGDTNGHWDVFVRDRGALIPPTVFCAGDGSAGACPCANSGSLGRGCQNSATTGGASLAAMGTASLAGDSLAITSSGELAQVLSIYLQGDSPVAAVAFGDGRRCVGGSLKRLYVLNATGGVVSAPPVGGPSISARSAALGDPIATGTARYYQVYYRDPSTTFCPAPTGGTFNVSNALCVLWGS